MLWLYRIVLYAMAPVVFMRFAWRAAHSSQYRDRLSQRLGFRLGLDPARDKKVRRIWIHAVSVGEVNAAAPLAKLLLEESDGIHLVVTTMTPTGSHRVGQVLPEQVEHCYLPYDYPGSVRRFLDCARPDVAVIMETEIWPNYIDACSRRKIPVILANVRLSARSFRGYRRCRRLLQPVLQRVDRIAVQSDVEAGRLVRLGARPASVQVTGSIKFEVDLPVDSHRAIRSLRDGFGPGRPVWVAGSTHAEEEVQVLSAFSMARKTVPDLLLVLVPRHPERFENVYRLCTRQGLSTLRRSGHRTEVPRDTEIYLGDTMGELPILIGASDVAFIGGSLVRSGGHNILEACAAGVAVLFGPHMFNFQEISDQVLSRGAGIQVMDSDELGQTVIRLVQDPGLREQYGTAGKQFVAENRGALRQVRELVSGYL